MSHDLRPTGAPAAAAPSAADGRRLRKLSLIGAALLVPATVCAGVVALASENAGRCLTYGEGCGSTPGHPYLLSLAAAAVSFAVVQGADRTVVGRTALGIQLGAELVFTTLVMTAFG
ncbi:hypothetical protein ACFWWS_36355 [Streptomyces sp. NPDC059083]|uniref:hypothetical protein n=1 Tax=unclassified Streptomyces TaxID=2593676 RepID=UPI003695E4C3